MALLRPTSAPPERKVRNGSSRPAAEPATFTSGAGAGRSIARNSKHLGPDDPNCRPSKKSPGHNFKAVDFSLINEDRHKSMRVDSFQTPVGHSGDIEETPPPKSGCAFQPMLLQALEADLFEEFHSCLDTLSSNVVGGLSDQLQTFRHEISDTLRQLSADLELLKGGAGVAKKAAAASSNKSEVIEEVRAGSVVVLESIQDNTLLLSEKISQLRTDMNTTEVRFGSATSLGTDLSPVPEETCHLFRNEAEVVDLSPVLAAILEMSRLHEESMESMRNLILCPRDSLQGGLHDAVAKTAVPRVEGDLTKVLRAVDEHASPSSKVLEDIHTCVQASAQDLIHVMQAFDKHAASATTAAHEERSRSLSKILQASEEHSAAAQATFREISQNVLGEVRRGWVEVGAIWCTQPDHSPKSPASAKTSPGLDARHDTQPSDVDFSVVLHAIRDMKSSVLSETLEVTREVRSDIKLGFSGMTSCIQSQSLSKDHVSLGNADEARSRVDAAGTAEALSHLQQAILMVLDANNEQQLKKVKSLEERVLVKMGSDQKLALIESQKMIALLDGIMDVSSSSQLDLSPVLDAITKLDAQPTGNQVKNGSDVSLNSVFRAITEISTSVIATQKQLSVGGKLPTEDDFFNLRQVLLSSLHDLEVSCEQLQEKMDNMEERLISRLGSNHKVAMCEAQKIAQIVDTTRQTKES